MERKILYLKQNGKMTHDGSNDKPFPVNFSIVNTQIARDQAEGRIYDYEVRIEGGTYYLEDAIEFCPHNEAKIHFTSQNDAQVIFSGGKRIGGFSETIVNGVLAFQTFLPQVFMGELDFKELYVNKEVRFRPTYPRNDFLRIDEIPGHTLQDSRNINTDFFKAKAGDLDHLTNINDAEIIAVHYWIEERMPVVSYDKNTRLVKCSRKSRFILKDDIHNDFARYKVENVFEELKEVGEWYLNKKSGILYYIPKEGETIENILVEVPVLKKILHIQTDHISFSNVIFECTQSFNSGIPDGFTKQTDENPVLYANSGQAASNIAGAVVLNHAKYCSFENCTFRNLGNYAIEIGNGCFYNAITQCRIYQCGGGGIKITGENYHESEALSTGYTTITNNQIHHCTLVHYSAVGIFIKNAFSSYIAHNEIHDLKYSGISVGWVWGFMKSRSCDNTIEWNHIFNLGDGQLSDLGGIYVLGPQGGSKISSNHVHHIMKANYGGYGIYLDEGSSNIVVEKNIVHHTDSECFFVHHAKENTVRCNIFAFGGTGIVCIAPNGNHHQGCFVKNIYITDHKPIYQGEDVFQHQKDRLISDANYVWDIHGREIFNSYGATTMEKYYTVSWQDWNHNGYDNLTKLGEIKINPERFLLEDGAEIFRFGFPDDLDITKIGGGGKEK